MDIWLNRSLSRCQRLVETEWKVETFHQVRSCLFCRQRRHCDVKPGATVLFLGPDSRSQMFLWVPNGNGEHPFLDLFFADWYLYQRSSWKGFPFQCGSEYLGYQIKGKLGSQMDKQWKNIPWETCCFCSCWRNFLLRVFLLDFLVEKAIPDARIDLFQWIDFQRWGTSHRFRLYPLQQSEEQTEARNHLRDHHWSCSNWKEIHNWIITIRFGWD